jgi:23S rRNA pseudouridine2457 synthase
VFIALHKPYGVISRFTPDGSPNRTLAGFGLPRRVYPVGRLDADSEGLLLLSDEGEAGLLDPERGHEREYWVQVERVPGPEALQKLREGVIVRGYRARPAEARVLEPQPDLPAREPPIRFRKNVPDCWISLVLREGKNRQVRRMTAAVGHPTLRLIRVRIGGLSLGDLLPGHWRELTPEERDCLTRYITPG